MSGKSSGIDEQIDSLRSDRIKYNRTILRTMVETVVLAGRQNLALRGHRDDSKHYLSTNPGNFQAFLNYRISGCSCRAFPNCKAECNLWWKLCGKQKEKSYFRNQC